jgi:hypothetical protein
VTPAWGGGNLCDRTRLPQSSTRVREPRPVECDGRAQGASLMSTRRLSYSPQGPACFSARSVSRRASCWTRAALRASQHGRSKEEPRGQMTCSRMMQLECIWAPPPAPVPPLRERNKALKSGTRRRFWPPPPCPLTPTVELLQEVQPRRPVGGPDGVVKLWDTMDPGQPFPKQRASLRGAQPLPTSRSPTRVRARLRHVLRARRRDVRSSCSRGCAE